MRRQINEQREGEHLYNSAVCIGPEGVVSNYRKTHLPFLGVDRFVTPGTRPYEVFNLGGLKVGILICFDGSFPESARILTLLGADLVVLPTNWATNARKMAELVSAARGWARSDRRSPGRTWRRSASEATARCAGSGLFLA